MFSMFCKKLVSATTDSTGIPRLAAEVRNGLSLFTFVNLFNVKK